MGISTAYGDTTLSNGEQPLALVPPWRFILAVDGPAKWQSPNINGRILHYILTTFISDDKLLFADLVWYSFNDLLKLQEEFYDVKTLGISYESDILLNASVAFYKVTNFLQIKPNSIDNADAFSSMHHKGLLCPLSDMLINYDELTCTLSKFDNRVSLSVHPISWMASDVDLHNVTFESAMQSWNNLWEHIGWGHLQECSPADIRASSRFVRHAINISSSVKSGLGQCIVGEDTFACKHLPAVGQNQLFCLLAMHRMGCDAMTFKSNDGCYLHSKNATEFRIVKCSSTSYYRYVNSSKL